jgi:hypothetical protein
MEQSMKMEAKEEVKEEFPYMIALLGGQKIRLYHTSVMVVKTGNSNSCGHCRAPFVQHQTQIVKVAMCNAARSI